MSVGHHEPEEIVYRGISSLDEPSVRWGWHSHSRKLGASLGIFFAAFLLLMLIGNHKGHVEDIWLVGVAVAMLLLLVLGLKPKKDLTAKKNRVWDVTDPQHYLHNPDTAAFLDRSPSLGRSNEHSVAAGSHARSGVGAEAGSSAIR